MLGEGRSEAGQGHIVLVAAGDPAADTVGGAAARARTLGSRGVVALVVLLGDPAAAPGLSRVAEAGGTLVRSVADGAGLAAALESLGRAAGGGPR